MLQEWLEELAEDEMKKTASSQFEEVLHEMDIPELKAFFEMNQGLEKSAQDPAAPDPAADAELPPGFERIPGQVMRRPAFGGVMAPIDPNQAEAMSRRESRGAALAGGITGSALGGLTGGSYGAELGGVRGALLGGLGGAALGGAAGYGIPRAAGPWAAQRAREVAVKNRDLLEQIQAGTKKPPLMSRLEEQLQGTPESMKYAAAQDPEGTYNKIKQAVDAGRSLVQLGFIPGVIRPSFSKEAQASEPIDPRIQAAAMRGGALGQGISSGVGGGALGGILGGHLAGGTKGALGGAGVGVGTGALRAQRRHLEGEIPEAATGWRWNLTDSAAHAAAMRERERLEEAAGQATAERLPKQASFRDMILKVAADGNLPQNHGWEL